MLEILVKLGEEVSICMGRQYCAHARAVAFAIWPAIPVAGLLVHRMFLGRISPLLMMLLRVHAGNVKSGKVTLASGAALNGLLCRNCGQQFGAISK
jgi:hypothetical protein